MDSVSVLLNIFRPKCEHAAELRTFRFLNCSLSFEGLVFLCHPAYMSHRKKRKKYLPTLPNVFSAVTRATQLFFLPKFAVAHIGYFKHVVASRISKHFTEQNILYELQHGFLKKRSCETQLIMPIDELAKRMQSRKQTGHILDFSKAFDKVAHKNYY